MTQLNPELFLQVEDRHRLNHYQNVYLKSFDQRCGCIRYISLKNCSHFLFVKYFVCDISILRIIFILLCLAGAVIFSAVIYSNMLSTCTCYYFLILDGWLLERRAANWRWLIIKKIVSQRL